MRTSGQVAKGGRQDKQSLPKPKQYTARVHNIGIIEFVLHRVTDKLHVDLHITVFEQNQITLVENFNFRNPKLVTTIQVCKNPPRAMGILTLDNQMPL